MHLVVGKNSPQIEYTISMYFLKHDYYKPIVRLTIFGAIVGDGVKLGEFLSHSS